VPLPSEFQRTCRVHASETFQRDTDDSEDASFFCYRIYCVYIPTGIVGGAVITVLTFFANFVASGYEHVTMYANSPRTIHMGTSSTGYEPVQLRRVESLESLEGGSRRRTVLLL